LDKREPKLVEGAKTALFVKGSTTSELVVDAMKDLVWFTPINAAILYLPLKRHQLILQKKKPSLQYALKRPNAVLFSKRNDLHPFDDPRPLEFLSNKNDSSIIAFASHSKKRPHNLVIARMFDHQLLDLVELGVVRGLPSSAFPDVKQPMVGNRPVLVFQGDMFEVNETYKSIKNVLVDFFRGEVADMVNLKGVEHVLSVTVEPSGKLQIRGYHVKLLKQQVTLPGAEGPAVTSSKLPKVALVECGPSLELEVRRTRFADASLYKEALKVPQELKVRSTKRHTSPKPNN
jgi:ribosome production factor 2